MTDNKNIKYNIELNHCSECGRFVEYSETMCRECAEKKEQDNVNHPTHYQGKHECIDIMRALFGDEAVKGFCKCNAFKYRFRADKKNGAEDIQKAEWYEEYLMKMESEEI